MALSRLGLMNVRPSERFDRITRLACQLFGAPVGAVSLIDGDRQRLMSRVGTTLEWLPRENSLCARVAEQGRPIVIPDLHARSKMRDRPGLSPDVRFYAGAPLVTRDGIAIGALCVLSPDPLEVNDAAVLGLQDLAALVMAQVEMEHAVGRIDPISGLPNRNQFFDDIEDLARTAGGAPRMAVVVDLASAEQVAHIQRVLGPAKLDAMIMEGAAHICAELGPRRRAYQVSPTQIAFIGPARVDTADYVMLLEEELVRTRGRTSVGFVAEAAIGVTSFIPGKTSPRDVLRQASAAALDARHQGSPVGVHCSARDSAHRRRFRLLQDFETALLDPEQLRLVYQPRIDFTTMRCHQAEALLRWRHPELGEVSPGEFIPIVEHSALARAMTGTVIDMALAHLARIRETRPDFSMSVNVSVANLEEPDFAGKAQLYLFKHRVPPEALELEVTESLFVAKPRHAQDQLALLNQAGIRLAVDDFGTGYSSLARLHRLPAQVVKIDQSFVRDMAASVRHRKLVAAMIRMSQDMGFRVVAEGVEDSLSATMLRDMGCDEGQGYYFGAPMEADAFVEWLKSDAVARRAA